MDMGIPNGYIGESNQDPGQANLEQVDAVEAMLLVGVI